TRAPYFSFRNSLNMIWVPGVLTDAGQHFPGQQFHTFARQFVAHVADLAAGQHHADAQLLLVLGQLLSDRLWTAGDDEHPLFEVVPRFLLREELPAIADDGQDRAGRGVARRSEGDLLEQEALEIAQVRLDLLAGLAVGLGHVDGNAPAHLAGRSRVA